MTNQTLWMATLLFVLTANGIAKADDSEVLFDGRDLDHWTVINCEAVVEDGAILLKSGNGLVQTRKKYTDFVFEFDWKALNTELWDSGVYFRYDDIPEGRPWPKRYQMNLRKAMECDLVGFENAKNKVPVKPHEWNRCELTVKGSQANLKINGQLSWEVDGIEQRESYIALQAEVPGGGQFLFRNIRVRELTPEKVDR